MSGASASGNGNGAARDEAPRVPASPARTRQPMAVRDLDRIAWMVVVFLGVAAAVEWSVRPERRPLIAASYAIQVAGCLAAMLVARRLPAGWTARVAALLIAALSLQVGWYNAMVVNHADRVAMALMSIEYAAAVVLAAGWRLQLVVALGALAGFAVAVPNLPSDDTVLLPWLGVVVGSISSVFGAALLERYREKAGQEAAVNAALLRVAETLDENLGQPDMLERVNQLALGLLGCDWSNTYLREAEGRTGRLHASAGLKREERTEIAQISFPVDGGALLQAFRSGELIEVADAAEQQVFPSALVRRFGGRSGLYVPIARGPGTAGLISFGWRERVGPFSHVERRLALGIARLVAVALENGRLIAQLQAVSRLKSEFVAAMSHELRTPLNAIAGYTDLLVDGGLGELEPPQLAALHRVRRNSFQLAALIEETLALGRIEAGRARLEISSFDLDEVFAEIASGVDSLLAAEVALRWRNQLGGEAVRTDRVKLNTILKNLVGNALKFTHRGSVEVSAARSDDGEEVVFAVRDTGIGIAAEDVPHIFEMFRQLDGSPARAFEGVGLGLHIVARLVDLLGGRVDVESTPGVGSTFTVAIPSAAALEHDREIAPLEA